MTPLKILHVGNFSVRPKGAGFFGVPFKLSNGLVRCGHNVLSFSDRDVATVLGHRIRGAKAANRALIRLASDFRPDVVLLGHAHGITAETVEQIRSMRRGVKLAQWSVDALFDADNAQRIRRKLPVVDVTFVSSAGKDLDDLRSAGHRVAFLPNPVDPSIERAKGFECPRERLAYDLFFATGSGSDSRYHAGRETSADEITARIVAAVPVLRGDFPGAHGAPRKFGAAYETALASAAMGLNISRRNDRVLYSSDRLAHLMGSGLLTFIDRATGYDALFGEEEMVFYATEDELIEGIRRYLADDAARRRVAEAGWSAYRRLFEVSRVAGYMIDVLFEHVDPMRYEWAR